MKIIKALIICPHWPEIKGGIGSVVGYLVDAWKDQDDAPVYRILDPRGPGNVLWSPFYLIRALFVAAKSILFDGFNIVHINISIRASSFRKTIVYYMSSFLGARTIVHLHGGRYPEFFADLPGPVRFLTRMVFVRADRVVVLGRGWKTFVCEKIGVDPERVEILYNAVPSPAAPSSGSPDGRCRILFLGQLGANKGVPELLQALASDHMASLSWSAIIAGDGDREGYQDKAVELGIGDRVTFPGWVAREAVADYFGETDVLVLPSHREALPMVVLEGMAYGVAVLSTPVGAVAEVIEDEKTGLLVAPGDVEALSKALARVTGDRDLRQKLGRAARQEFLAHFESAEHARRVTDIYRRVLADSREARK